MTKVEKKKGQERVQELIIKNQFEDMNLRKNEFYIELFFDKDDAQWCIQRNTSENLVITVDGEYLYKLDDELSELVEEFISEETRDERESLPYGHYATVGMSHIIYG
ncbi:DUF1892 domain-containing protein [Elizabethkingia ursingii]|uniref:DUF1892 domain-containing protein n=1 Tax=Elizabethkingia ursingii TaxID=1756150 RepID=UPI002012C7BB|nr:DUF1892 domain-containing protein [Elizabethkingia ursingii]MCL1666398.1 DUF1892 domain-containing protein [Elizabethkingia ursingii]